MYTEDNFQLDSVWQFVAKDYTLKKKLGQGAYGLVVQAISKETGRQCAIKLIKDVFTKVDGGKYALREIKILRQLSKCKDNVFTPKLLDVVLPPVKDEDDNLTFKDLFIIMEAPRASLDLLKMLSKLKASSLSDTHVKTIIYNLLCSVNFLH